MDETIDVKEPETGSNAPHCSGAKALEQQRDAWRAACRYLYEIIGEGGRKGRPLDLISKGDWGRVISLIGKAECLDCFKTFDCANGAHSDCCPTSGRPDIEKQAELVCAFESCATEMAQNVARAFLEMRTHVMRLGKDHPDTPVTWPFQGITRYQDIQDWASFVLYGGK